MTTLQFSIVVLSCLLALHSRSLAQVTFSKDWNAGKRSLAPQPSECAANIKPSIAFCQMFLNEMRQMASCEIKSLFHKIRDDQDEAASLYAEGLFISPRDRRR